ncbi:hypothetical protein MRX96_055641 [Rhipicephalus microplus]
MLPLKPRRSRLGVSSAVNNALRVLISAVASKGSRRRTTPQARGKKRRRTTHIISSVISKDRAWSIRGKQKHLETQTDSSSKDKRKVASCVDVTRRPIRQRPLAARCTQK